MKKMSKEKLGILVAGPVPRCTMYIRGAFGYERIEVRNLSAAVTSWAQCARACRIAYIEKGHRIGRARMETEDGSTVVLLGWGHGYPPSGHVGGPSEVVVSKYDAYNPAYDHEFSEWLDAYLAEKGTAPLPRSSWATLRLKKNFGCVVLWLAARPFGITR